MTTPPTISEQFVMDLVEKIRESSALTANELKELTIAITSLVEAYNAENRTAARDHNDAMQLLGDIKTKTNSIVKSVRTMIITVIVAFSLLTGAYLLVRNSVKDMIHSETTRTEHLLKEHIEDWEKFQSNGP